jgi:glucose-1-phosphate cytidylyltransferase
MIEIGGKPILWNVMKNYSSHGINEFIIKKDLSSSRA